MNYRRALIVFLLLLLFSQIADRLLFIIIPMWLLERSFSATEIGAIFSVAALVTMVSMFMISKLSDRWGRKRIMVTGLFTNAISTAFYPAASKLFDYLAIKSVQDAGAKLKSSVENSMRGDKFKGEERERAIHVLGIALPLSRACAMIAGIAITTFLSVVYGFYVAAIFFMLACIIVLLFYDESGFVKCKEKKIMRFQGITPQIKLISLVNFCNSICFALGYTPAFFILSRSLGLAEKDLFIFYMLAYLVSTLFAWKTASWIKRHGNEKMVAATVFTYGVFTALYAIAYNVPLLLLSLVAVAVSYYIYNIAYTNVLLDFTDDKNRGEQTGFSNMLGDIGMIAGPFIAGLLIDHVSLQAAFISAGLFGIIGAIAALYLRRYRRA